MKEIGTQNNLFVRHYAEIRGSLTEPDWLVGLRDEAIAHFDAQGVPTIADEEWRFTNLAEFAQLEFQLGARGAADIQQLERLPVWNVAQRRMVFVDGRYSPEFSNTCGSASNIEVRSLSSALATHPELANYLTRIAPQDLHPFLALNTALFRDGAFVRVKASPRQDSVLEDLVVLHVTTGATPRGAYHVRNLILVEDRARLRLVEIYCSLTPEMYFTNPVTEVLVGRESEAEHYRIQWESPAAYQLGAVQARVLGHSSYSIMNIAYGGLLSRADLGIEFAEAESQATLNGLFFLGEKQHADFHTVIDHAKPYCESHELVKGILRDKARGVFNGRIIVRPGAQRTNARQTNRNLLLSRTALVNTNPQLEIFADDVKCTHGATVGHLDETQLFYLRARGISAAEAQSLLTYAFANDVLRRITIQPLRELLESEVLNVEHLRADEDLLEAL